LLCPQAGHCPSGLKGHRMPKAHHQLTLWLIRVLKSAGFKLG